MKHIILISYLWVLSTAVFPSKKIESKEISTKSSQTMDCVETSKEMFTCRAVASK